MWTSSAQQMGNSLKNSWMEAWLGAFFCGWFNQLFKLLVAIKCKKEKKVTATMRKTANNIEKRLTRIYYFDYFRYLKP